MNTTLEDKSLELKFQMVKTNLQNSIIPTSIMSIVSLNLCLIIF